VRRIGAVAIALLLAACSTTVTGQGTVGSPPADPSSAQRSTSPTSFPSPSASSGGAPSSAAPSPAYGSLVDQLMTPPAGSVPWTSAWARNRTPTIEQFVRWAYPADVVSAEVRLLRSYGLEEIAHETWFALNHDQADMILFRFRDEHGAIERYVGATQAKRKSPGIRSFTVPGTSAIGYYHPELDRLGNVTAIVYALHGRTVVEEFYYSPKRLRPADARAWLKAQLARLP
jgi:hypothetical protein